MMAEFAEIGRIDGDERAAEVASLDWGPAAGAGPIVEIGAGTGYVTAILAAAAGGEIFAVERSAAARAALMTRVVADPDLRERVTVVPGDFFAVALPDRWRGALAFHFLCQLNDEQRERFWPYVATHLAPGAPLYVDRHWGVGPGGSVAEKVAVEVRVGRHIYQRRFGAEPHESGGTLVRNSYRVLSGDQVVLEETVEELGSPYSESQAIAQAAAAGLAVDEAGATFLRFAGPRERSHLL